MEKHAILVTAYKNLEHIIRIADSLDERFELYVHIDKKTELTSEIWECLQNHPYIKFVCQKYKVYWGDLNHLKCILFLCEEALKNKDIFYFHTISGCDYVIKSPDFFSVFFQINRGKEFIQNFRLPDAQWSGGGLNRLKYYYINGWVDAKTYEGYQKMQKYIDLQVKYHIQRKIANRLLPIYGGSIWWSLSRECILYVINYTHKKSYFLRRLKYTFIPEEVYFQTIILHSEFAGKVVNDNLRYIVWQTRNGNYPANLDATDIKPILLSNGLFARKMEYLVSLELMRCLDNLRKERLQLPISGYWDLNILLKEISSYFFKSYKKCLFHGMFYGKMGICIFQFLYANYLNDQELKENAYKLLNDIIDENEGSEDLSYEEGIIGIGVGIEYLHVNHFIDNNTNGVLEDLDMELRNLSCVILSDGEALGHLNILRGLEKYFSMRVLNRFQINEANRLILDRIRTKLSFFPSIDKRLHCLSLDSDYIAQIDATYHVGLAGYAGIGLMVLSGFTHDLSWQTLCD